MKIQKNKKAFSHVEMILSFILFVGFLIFILVYINPFSRPQNTSLLDIATNNFIDNFSTDIMTVSINIKNPLPPNCFNIEIEDFECNKKITAKNIDNQLINSKIVIANKIAIQTSGNFYIIYCSDELQEQTQNLDNCQEVNENLTSIGIIRNYQALSLNKINNFANLYNNNYEEAKKILKLPENADFSFSVRNSTKSIIASGKINAPQSLNVIAKETPIALITSKAEINPHILSINIW